MKNFRIVSLLLAVFAVSASSLSAYETGATEGLYFDVMGGVNFLGKVKNKPADGDVAPNSRSKYNAGWMGGIAAGYLWCNGFRAEGELAYRHNGLKSVEKDSFGDGGPTPYTRDHGSLNVWSFMVNGLYQWNDLCWWDLKPFVGVGLGGASVKYKATDELVMPNTISSSHSAFAYQAIAGVAYPIACSWDLSLEYRFFGTAQGKFKDAQGNRFKASYASHAAVLGVKYFFCCN